MNLTSQGRKGNSVRKIITDAKLEKFFQLNVKKMKDTLEQGKLIVGWLFDGDRANIDRSLMVKALSDILGLRCDEVTFLADQAALYDKVRAGMRSADEGGDALDYMQGLSRGKMTHILDLIGMRAAHVHENGLIYVHYNDQSITAVTEITSRDLADLLKDHALMGHTPIELKKARARWRYYKKMFKAAEADLQRFAEPKKSPQRKTNIVKFKQRRVA